MRVMKPGVWLLVFLLGACTQEQTVTKKYFDFDKLIDEQISLLAGQHRTLVKAASLGAAPKDSVFRPSKQGWERELEAFRLLENINKPAFQNLYTVQDALADPQSNLKIHQFSSDKARVALVRLYYHDNLSRLKKIECVLFQKNLLYANSDQLTMLFDEENGKNVLTGYTMHGYQKMILGDTVRFTVRGTIE
jgi:hypothetical protein